MTIKNFKKEIPKYKWADFTCPGFVAHGLSCGIKKSGMPDLAVILSEKPAKVAGVFTTNRVKAASVLNDKKRLRRKLHSGVVVNSGNANACTGEQGIADDAAFAAFAEEALNLKKGDLFTASTGVIGVPLPIKKIEKGVKELAGALTPAGFGRAAKAMMTTDAFQKAVVVEGRVGGRDITILGVAKGAGMIRPDMATMLAFFCTDANINKIALQDALRVAVVRSFNSICVDNDMSTNDTVLAMANGVAGGREIALDDSALMVFTKLLTDAAIKLAKMIVRDGEGATRLVEITVSGAKSDIEAMRAARGVAESMLVKTAIFGGDPNWGRVISAIGMSGVVMDPNLFDLSINGVKVASKGLDTGMEKDAAKAMNSPEVALSINLRAGEGAATFWTTDLSYEYIKINSEYRT